MPSGSLRLRSPFALASAGAAVGGAALLRFGLPFLPPCCRPRLQRAFGRLRLRSPFGSRRASAPAIVYAARTEIKKILIKAMNK